MTLWYRVVQKVFDEVDNRSNRREREIRVIIVRNVLQ